MHRTLTTIAACLLTSGAHAINPEAFTDISFADAMKQNVQHEGQALLVLFNANWNRSSERLHETVWSDPGLVEHLKAHNIRAITVDLEDHPDMALAYSIENAPTIVLFKDGERLESIERVRRSTQVIDWINGVLDIKMEKPETEHQKHIDIQERLRNASELTRAGRHKEATEEFVWLWDNMLEIEPSLYGVRGSFMMNDMMQLASAYPPALEAFTQLRDDLSKQVEDGDESHRVIYDWMILNIRLLEDHDTVMAWVNEKKDSASGIEKIRSHGTLMGDWLLERGQWKIAGLVHGDPESIVEQSVGRMRLVNNSNTALLDERSQARLKARSIQKAFHRFGRIHAAYLAADRTEDAWALYDALVKDFDPDLVRVAMCQGAISADQVRERHKQLAGELNEWAHRDICVAILSD